MNVGVEYVYILTLKKLEEYPRPIPKLTYLPQTDGQNFHKI